MRLLAKRRQRSLTSARSSAESRNHPSPVTGAGGVAAATSLGMSLSVVLMYPWPEHVMDSKGPFYVFATMLLVGNLAFLLVEVLEWPHFLLLACRVLMSLGFGAGFAAKRRAAFHWPLGRDTSSGVKHRTVR